MPNAKNLNAKQFPRQLETWPTKYTALYVTFWRPKLRGQFSENLVLWIYEFFFNFGDRISKEKVMKVLKNENLKYDKHFQLTHCFFN